MNGATVPASPSDRLGEELFHVRNHALLRAIIDNLSEGVSVADTSGNFLYTNAFARKIYSTDGVTSGPSEEWTTRHGIFRPDGKTLMPVEELPIWTALKGKPVRDF